MAGASTCWACDLLVFAVKFTNYEQTMSTPMMLRSAKLAQQERKRRRFEDSQFFPEQPKKGKHKFHLASRLVFWLSPTDLVSMSHAFFVFVNESWRIFRFNHLLSYFLKRLRKEKCFLQQPLPIQWPIGRNMSKQFSLGLWGPWASTITGLCAWRWLKASRAWATRQGLAGLESQCEDFLKKTVRFFCKLLKSLLSGNVFLTDF